MIDGVETKPLKFIPDERGYLMEILRVDDPIFEKFGQVYLTVAYPGVVKAWHYHRKQTDLFAVIKGEIKLVLYDQRKNSPTRGEIDEFFLGEKNPLLVRIPPEVVHGFKAVGIEPGYVINCATLPYNRENPDEHRIDPRGNEIPYDWALREG